MKIINMVFKYPIPYYSIALQGTNDRILGICPTFIPKPKPKTTSGLGPI